MTIRAVLDTNVLVSTLLNPHGIPAAVLGLVLARTIQPCISPAVLAEYVGVLNRPKFPFQPQDVRKLITFIQTNGVLVTPHRRLSVCGDEGDNRFLECAEAADARYLVTGNKRHFPKRWQTTEIVNAREILSIVTREAGE